MTKRIYKYQLPGRPGTHELMLPFNTHILTMQAQGGVPTMWGIVPDGVRGVERRRFRIDYTGDAVPDDQGQYIGTCQVAGLVLHVFEVANG